MHLGDFSVFSSGGILIVILIEFVSLHFNQPVRLSTLRNYFELKVFWDKDNFGPILEILILVSFSCP